MATLKDIADKVGVASSTVSRVLNQDDTLSITAEKRQLINKVAIELGYLSPIQRKKQRQQQSAIAARTHYKLANGDALNLVVVHCLSPNEELNDPYYTAIRIGIENSCHQHNIALRNTFANNLAANSSFLQQAQAVICVGHFKDQDVTLIQSLNPNLIFVDSNPLDKQCDVVQFDREAASREIVGNMISADVQRPAFIGNDETRLHVFREMTQAHGIYDSARCKVSTNFCIDSGYLAMTEMLSTQPWPDVVFAATDIIAIGVYRAIQERDIEIPKDIQVISMNDIPTAQHMNPSLTTMRLYATEMGEAAVDLFMELVAGRQYHKTVQLGYEMIWRKSFAKPL